MGSRDYNGGLFPVWIVLNEPVKDANAISWKTGSSSIAYRKQARDANRLITADTAFLYWDEPPPELKVEGDNDTAYYYRDTIFAIVNGMESLPIVIEVKNILPRITSLSINGLKQPGDSLLTIAAHPGDRLEISISLEKPFNNAFKPEITMPRTMNGLRLKSKSDSLWVYEWSVSNDIIADSSGYLKIKDSGGHGERLYKVHLIVYTESGSVWVASEKELVKYSPTGVEITRISENFNFISALAINSNNGRLFVTDQSKNSFTVYDTYGKQLYKSEDLFKTPTGVVVDVVEGGYVWVADENGLRGFKFTGDSLNSAAAISHSIGPIKGLAANQFHSGLVWFTIPQSDTVGYVENATLKYTPNAWNRPEAISLDRQSGITWVADSSRVLGIDASGKVLANIKNFGFVSSVSASNGNVWASDILQGKVYRFSGPFRGSDRDTNLTIINGVAADYKFLSPISVSALFTADGGAWVIDKEAGRAVRLDSLGKVKAYGTGLKLPNLSVTLQKVE